MTAITQRNIRQLLMRNPNLIRIQVDRKLRPWQSLDSTVPPSGWLKTIRSALGMTTRQLGERLGVTRQAVMDLERREVEHTVTLAALGKAAEAMDCQLVYAIVPRTSLSKILIAEAHAAAEKEIGVIAHSMRLEQQGTSKAEVDRLVTARANELLAGKRRELWDATTPSQPARRGRPRATG
jgi:predicted DNA-binding mobile mystery protein A